MLASATRISKLTIRWIAGRRTIRIPDFFHIRLVKSRLGLIQPRRPASTRRAGRKVHAPRQPTAIATARATPTVEKTVSLVNTIPRKVTATVAADAVITLPTDSRAARTAVSESVPIRRKS